MAFSIQGTNLKAHKFILAARSEYFQQMFEGKWNDRERVSISNALVRRFCHCLTHATYSVAVLRTFYTNDISVGLYGLLGNFYSQI